ncbi:MAG: tetratricopeptide repeat protein, partial [Desulfococcaceae bacterium]
PENEEFLIYLASFYEEVEDFEAAVETLNRALEIEPDSVRIRFRLGVVYDQWDRKTDSIEMMKTVIDMDPKNANALNYLGYTYADMGIRLDEAERLIREALKYKPDDGYIIDSLGWVFYRRGDYETALVHLLRATELAPDDPVILEHVGDAYHKLDEPEKALEYYRRSLEKRDPEEDAGDIRKLREKMRALEPAEL